jgi:hypothetical protein
VYNGRRAQVEEVRLSVGRATPVRSGLLDVWNYGVVVPPAVLAARAAPAKVFAIRGGVVRVYYERGGGAVVADATVGGTSVAVVDRSGDNELTVRAVQQLTRRGSP